MHKKFPTGNFLILFLLNELFYMKNELFNRKISDHIEFSGHRQS